MTDKQIKAAIAVLLAAGSGSATRVNERWKMSVRLNDWKATLRSVTNNNVIDGWYITRVARRSKFMGPRRWDLEYDYDLFYFKSVREGTDEDNSEDELNELLESVAEQFELSATLGFSAMVNGVQLNRHSEIQIRNIDTIDNSVHCAQCRLTVFLTKQPTS